MSVAEIWVDIQGFESYYQVSNAGRVRSKSRVVACSRLGSKTLQGRLLTTTVDSTGYCRVTLQDKPRKVVWKVHRLVATHFLEPVPGCNIVNHLDNIRTNNAASNLEWATPQKNTAHMHAQGRNADFGGSKNPGARLTSQQVDEIRSSTLPHQFFADKFGINRAHVASIRNGRRWRDSGDVTRIVDCATCQ